jgi:hypothetical protein
MTDKVKYASLPQQDLTAPAPDSPSSPVTKVAQAALTQEVTKEPFIGLKGKIFAVTILGTMATVTALSLYDTIRNPEPAAIVFSAFAGTLTSVMCGATYKIYKALTAPFTPEEPTPAESAV